MAVAVLDLIEAAVREINDGDHDSFGTLRVIGDDGRWLQYTPGMINAAYPVDVEPTQALRDFNFTAIEEWTQGASVMVELFFPEPELAVWIDRYFKEILKCDPGYQLTWKREQ